MPDRQKLTEAVLRNAVPAEGGTTRYSTPSYAASPCVSIAAGAEPSRWITATQDASAV